MWYAVSIGAGLLLGLGLLIWGLRERSKRHEADGKASDLSVKLGRKQVEVDGLNYRLRVSQSELDRSNDALDRVRTMLDVVRAKMMVCKDPKVVKTWLDQEMRDKDL